MSRQTLKFLLRTRKICIHMFLCIMCTKTENGENLNISRWICQLQRKDNIKVNCSENGSSEAGLDSTHLLSGVPQGAYLSSLYRTIWLNEKHFFLNVRYAIQISALKGTVVTDVPQLFSSVPSDKCHCTMWD